MKAHKLNEEELIKVGLSKMGGDAYQKALSNGIAVTVLRDGDVCRVQPDGKVVVIRKISAVKPKLTSLRFKIK